MKTYLIVMAIFLLVVIMLHMIEYHHDHPRALFGDGLQATLHGEEKKWWMIIFFFCLAYCRYLYESKARIFLSYCGIFFSRLNQSLLKAEDYLLKAFRRGILHPRLYS